MLHSLALIAFLLQPDGLGGRQYWEEVKINDRTSLSVEFTIQGVSNFELRQIGLGLFENAPYPDGSLVPATSAEIGHVIPDIPQDWSVQYLSIEPGTYYFGVWLQSLDPDFAVEIESLTIQVIEEPAWLCGVGVVLLFLLNEKATPQRCTQSRTDSGAP